MIKYMMVFNTRGQARAMKFFESCSVEVQRKLLHECYQVISKRDIDSCNFVEFNNYKLVYRQYATLYFVLGVDETECEYDIFELIHSFVQCLDQHFENVCELDLIFHSDKVNQIISEVFMAGFIIDRNSETILEDIRAQTKLERQESGVLTQVGSKLKSAVDNKTDRIKSDVEKRFSKLT